MGNGVHQLTHAEALHIDGRLEQELAGHVHIRADGLRRGRELTEGRVRLGRIPVFRRDPRGLHLAALRDGNVTDETSEGLHPGLPKHQRITQGLDEAASKQVRRNRRRTPAAKAVNRAVRGTRKGLAANLAAHKVRDDDALRLAARLGLHLLRDLALVADVNRRTSKRTQHLRNGVVLRDLLARGIIDDAASRILLGRRRVGLLGRLRTGLLQLGHALLDLADKLAANLVERLARLDQRIDFPGLDVGRLGETERLNHIIGGETRLDFRLIHDLDSLLLNDGGCCRRIVFLRTPDTDLGVSRAVHKTRFMRHPLHRTVDGVAVLGFAHQLVLLHAVAHGHIAPQALDGILLDLLRTGAAAELDLAAELAILDFGLAHEADLVSPVRVLDDQAILHAGEVNLALGVAQHLVALDVVLRALVPHPAAVVRCLAADGKANGLHRCLALTTGDKLDLRFTEDQPVLIFCRRRFRHFRLPCRRLRFSRRHRRHQSPPAQAYQSAARPVRTAPAGP